VSFGSASFGYYETIAGGAGAGPGFAGASAVHTHMTNTRITDPEIIEQRFPVRIREFSVRRGSGGAGCFRGGDGICREYEFLEPLTVSLLSERRLSAPFGLAGGKAGGMGRNLHNGREVPGHASFSVAAGDRLRIETPGGGGYGSEVD
jgi:5-oxoprolinase (ATP-hydrolysing)